MSVEFARRLLLSGAVGQPEIQAALFRHLGTGTPFIRALLEIGGMSERASEEELMRWFQYPRGRGNPWGVIRHYPKHGDHMHVRFACHPSDPACKTFRPLLLQTARR